MPQTEGRWLVWYRYWHDGPLTERIEDVMHTEEGARKAVETLQAGVSQMTVGYRKLDDTEYVLHGSIARR